MGWSFRMTLLHESEFEQDTGLEEQDEISIMNYFRIFKQARAVRNGKNPKTGEPVAICIYQGLF